MGGRLEKISNCIQGKRKKEFVYLDIGGDPEDQVGRWLLGSLFLLLKGR